MKKNCKSDWINWWGSCGPVERFVPLIVGGGIIGGFGLVGLSGWDTVAVILVMLGLYYFGPKTQPVFFFLLPQVFIGIVYLSQPLLANGLRGPILIGEFVEWETALFGFPTEGGEVTPARWWQRHTHPILDLFTGLAYLSFIPVFLGIAGWLRFGSFRREDPGATDRRKRLARRILWVNFWLYMAGYAVWMAVPVAPPWYVDQYGTGPAQVDVPGDAAGAARFDALVGVPVFENYYARNTNVFGAFPSLHCGQTFLMLLVAFTFRRVRIFSVLFFLAVFFASVYLNHHYILDGLAGMLLAAAVWVLVFRFRGVEAPTSG